MPAADFPVRHDVIGIVEVEFVYFVLGYELIDIDNALALYRDCFQFFGRKLDIVALRDLITFDDVSDSTSSPVSASTF